MGRIDIFVQLSLPFQEQGMFFHCSAHDVALQ